MTSDARSRIEILLTEYADQVHCDVEDASETAADLIAIVREAMLTQEPLEAAADIWNHHHAPTCDRAITAALDAAFGEDTTTPPR